MTEIDRARIFDQASSELRSAYTLVADPQCDPLTAMPHLRRAWQAVAWLSRGEVPESAGEDLSAWLGPEHLELVPAGSRAQLHATLRTACELAQADAPWAQGEPAKAPELPPARTLLAGLRALGKVLKAITEQAHGRPLKTQLALRWGIRAAVVLASVTAFVLLALRPWQSEDVGPWRAAYYPNKSFDGQPDLRREVDVAFDWLLDPPTDSIPADYFSARFDTCLVLEEDTDIAFQLTSDDGSRLYIDGKKRVNNWPKHNARVVKGERVSLSAGVHHLRVEYYERDRSAKLHLTASFDENEAPGPISAQMLEFPGMEISVKGNPCVGVR